LKCLWLPFERISIHPRSWSERTNSRTFMGTAELYHTGCDRLPNAFARFHADVSGGVPGREGSGANIGGRSLICYDSSKRRS
jgi:hypothetical protein